MVALVAAGAVIAVVQSALAAPEQGKATVRSVKGTAEYSTGGAWAPLKAGAILGSGSAVKTGAGAAVVLDMGVNGRSIAVVENTTLGIDKLTFDKTGADVVTETQLDVKVGRIIGKVNKTSPASRFEIKTPTGVAGIRGTTFDISANGVVKVKDGCVIVIYVDPSGQMSQFEICRGFKFVPGVGQVPLTDEEMNSPDWNQGAVPGEEKLPVKVEPGINWVPPILPNDPGVSPVEGKPAR